MEPIWQEVLDFQGVAPVHNEHLPAQAPPDVLLFALFQEHSPCRLFALFQEHIWGVLLALLALPFATSEEGWAGRGCLRAAPWAAPWAWALPSAGAWRLSWSCCPFSRPCCQPGLFPKTLPFSKGWEKPPRLTSPGGSSSFTSPNLGPSFPDFLGAGALRAAGS